MTRLFYHFNKLLNPIANDALYKRFKNAIDPNSFPFFYESKFYIWPCVDLGCNFYVQNDRLRVALNGVVAELHNHEEVYIFYEVFYRRQYDFYGIKQPVVLDIGFNIGFSSIFFAKVRNAVRVYAFEPVHSTMEIGKQNLELNGLTESKIQLFEYGLASANKSLEVSIDPLKRGSTSLVMSDRFLSNSKSNTEVIVMDVSQVFDSLELEAHNVVCKIDCEGGEYEIIQRLADTNNLRVVLLYLIEWHWVDGHDYRNLSTIFESNGYIVSVTQENLKAGFLSAVRK